MKSSSRPVLFTGLLYLLCILSAQEAYIHTDYKISEVPAEHLPPVRSFPTGDDVLNRVNVKLPQPDVDVAFEPNGFAFDRLSEVPPVGVHPRIIMSPEDLPVIRENIEKYQVAKKAWGMVLDRVGHGKSEPNGTYIEGLYALIVEDDEYGRKAAEAYMERLPHYEAEMDEWDATNAFRKDHYWLQLRGTVRAYALGYDYFHKFLTEEERAEARRLISKGTFGRYNHGMELPRSWRTWNWAHFSMNIVNYALAIEGEEGFDPRVYDVVAEATNDFLTYKLSPNGYDYEATGYNAGLVWEGGGTESIMAIARREKERNPLMHAHFQNHANALIGQQSGPESPFYGRGDAAGRSPGFVLVSMMKYFYPEDPR